MALWKVIADRIKLFPHPNSDKLLVGKIGKFQVVVSKENGYRDGDVVVFAPERSILPEEICAEYVNTDTGVSYLHGNNHNRVGAVRLRGELSEGVTLPYAWIMKTLYEVGVMGATGSVPLGIDISGPLGIRKYIPTIPTELIGKVSYMNETEFGIRFVHHDVENFRTFVDEFTPGEMVSITEKLNGSQVNIMVDPQGKVTLTSKYLGQDGFVIDADPDNKYWKAVHNSGLVELPTWRRLTGHDVQIVAEMIPCAKGFTYGQTEPTVRIFRVVFNGSEIPVAEVFEQDFFASFRELWVPYMGTIAFDPEVFPLHAAGKEQVSGKSLHIREGIVITPKDGRQNSEHRLLAVKWLNPKYKASVEEIS